MDEIGLDESVEGQMSTSSTFFALPSSPSLDIRVTLDTEADGLELYVSHDRAPALNDSEFSTRRITQNNSVILPRKESGTYYLLLNTPGSPGADFVLTTESLEFSIENIGVTSGGTGRRVTSTITGAGFEPETKIILDPVEDPAGKNSSLTPVEGVLTAFTNTTQIDVRWELLGVPVGSYDVIVERTNGEQIRIEEGFEVQEPIENNITVSVSGSEFVRSGRNALYDITVRNDGNTDADFVFLVVAVPFYQQAILESHDFFDRPLPPDIQGEFELEPAGVQVDSIGLILAMNKDLRPGQELSARVTLPNVVSDVGEIPIYIEAYSVSSNEFILHDLHNFGEAVLDMQSLGSFDDVDPEVVRFLSEDWLETMSDLYFRTWLFGDEPRPSGLQRFVYQPSIILDAFQKAENEKNFRCETFGLLVGKSLEKSIKSGVKSLINKIKVPQAILNANKAVQNHWLAGFIARNSATIGKTLGKGVSHLGSFMLGLDVGALLTCEGMVRVGYIFLEDLKYLNADDCDDLDPYASLADALRRMYESTRAVTDGYLDYKSYTSSFLKAMQGTRAFGVGFVTKFIRTLAQDAGEVLCGILRFALDPNDILGPPGFGEEKWIPGDNVLPYTIRFENDPVFATAAAQSVRITQSPDSVLNISSFRLGTFGFGPFVFDVPPNRAFYSTRLDVSDSLGVWVDVNAGLDVTTNTLFWNMQSVDPITGLPPTDPFAGFLPVNDSTRIGEGFVTYTIRADEASMTGDRIDAEAEIVFDINEPIVTPPIFNTIDNTAPTSRVSENITAIDSTAFIVRWTGEDELLGSGIAGYDLYVAEADTGAFVLYQENIRDTAFVFTAARQNEYRFFTRAVDNVGNRESLKTEAEQVFRVSVEDPDEVALPEEFELFPNYPNPFNSGTTIRFALPESERVRIDVYNIIGQRVATLVDDERTAGYQSIQWDGTGDTGHRLSSGVYFYTLKTKDNHLVRKLVMVK